MAQSQSAAGKRPQNRRPAGQSGNSRSGTAARPRSGTATAARPRPNTQNANAKRRPPQSSSPKGSPSKKRRKKKKSAAPIVLLSLLVAVIAIVFMIYFLGYLYYSRHFMANTFINGRNVSGKTLDEAYKVFAHDEVPEALSIERPNGDKVKISLKDVNYSYNYKDEVKRIFDDIDHKSWFALLGKKTEYEFAEAASFDEKKLAEEIDAADWGEEKTVNAQLKSNDKGYYVIPDVQGDDFDMKTLKPYIVDSLKKAKYEIKAVDSGAYVPAKTVSADYDKKAETLNKLWNTEIKFNFDYTDEVLTGKKLCSLAKVSRNGKYTVDEDKCLEYVKYLSKKYDTYGTTRTFKSTNRGKIKVKQGEGNYGWWLDEEKMTDKVVKLVKICENKRVTPVYYESPYSHYSYTCPKKARSKNDDIGKTYCEVDLGAQHFWYYKDGKKKYDCGIVSGLPVQEKNTPGGIYKIWFKESPSVLKGEVKSTGEKWETKVSYWNNISLFGIGFHDATWQYSFGGDRYKYAGSHGCINMSYDAAKYVYENIPVGTPVVMYW